jgi:pyruvate dehydrogenase E2 component (dihydrolipoamide acetyltransferase)
MADITMPRLSDTMEEGTIATWLKKPGEQISKGEVIAQIETDKATMDLTAFEAGTLQEILAPEGTTVAIGQPVARLGNGKAAPASPAKPASSGKPEAAAKSEAGPKSEAGATPETGAKPEAGAKPAAGAKPEAGQRPEAGAPGDGADDAEDAVDAQPSGARSSDSVPPRTKQPRQNVAGAPDADAPADAQPADSAQTESVPGVSDRAEPAGDGQATDGKVRASPMARHIAAEHGLDLAEISGSGPQGRVIRADVEAALSAPQSDEKTDPAKPPTASPESAGPTTASEDDERVTLSQMRRTIARRMAESTRTVPHFFLTTTVDATDMVALRKQILEQTAGDGLNIKITFNDMIVKAAALALRKVPEVNVSFAEDSLIRHKRVHIGVAVATERGLIVPVLRDVDQKGLGQIARETRDLAERANAGKLQPADYTGGTFTISNLGMFGVEQFNAVINLPEAAILAVGAIAREPAEHAGEIVLRERLKLTLSVDHRALDGAMGARYLQALKQLLEKPMLLLV